MAELSPPERTLANRLIGQGITPEDAEVIARNAMAVKWSEVFVTSDELAAMVGKTRQGVEYRATRWDASPEVRAHIRKRMPGKSRARTMWLVDFAVPAFKAEPPE
jgi:hypothetical protein